MSKYRVSIEVAYTGTDKTIGAYFYNCFKCLVRMFKETKLLNLSVVEVIEYD